MGLSVDRFREELKNYDPRLEIVRDNRREEWRIEQDMGSARRKHLVTRIPFAWHNRLGPWIIRAIHDGTPMAQGGAAAMNRRFDEEDRRRDEAQERKDRDVVDAASDDAWGVFARQTGKRVTNVGVPYQVNDRRRIQEPVSVS